MSRKPPQGNKVYVANHAHQVSSRASEDPGHSVQVVADAPETTHHSWYNPGKTDIFFLGITIIMCGQYMSWNIGLVAGVYTYLIIYVVMGLAYITFCCCMAELTSALPFAGGSYGLARCTLGFFPAFLIGCAEALEYTMSVAIQAICVSDIIVQAAPALGQYRPLLWLVFYVPTVAVQCVGGAAFWIASTSLGAFQLVLLLVYCFGLLGDVSFRGNALAHSEMLFAGGLDVYNFPSVTGYILPVCLLFAFISYSGQCIGYILLTVRYPIVSHRAFKNPLGLVGAVYSLLVWVLGIFAIVGFQGHHGLEVAVFGVVTVLLGVYYLLVAKKRQVMSEEESKILLVAHITLFNNRKKHHRYTTQAGKPSSKGPSAQTHLTRPRTVESAHSHQVN